MLNHPFVLEQARVTAQKLLDDTQASDAQRVERIFRQTLGRTPSEREQQAALSYLAQANTEDAKLRTWSQLCQSLFASIDFRYIE